MTVLDDALEWAKATPDAIAMSNQIGHLCSKLYPRVSDGWKQLTWRAPRSCALILRRLHEQKTKGGDDWTVEDSIGFLQMHIESMLAVLVETRTARRKKSELQKAN